MKVAYVQVSTAEQGQDVTGEKTDNSSALDKVTFVSHYIFIVISSTVD